MQVQCVQVKNFENKKEKGKRKKIVKKKNRKWNLMKNSRGAKEAST
jgi:hypothetical protein